jgi:phage-related protein
VVNLWNGIAGALGWLASNIASIAGTVWRALGDFYTNAYNIGRNIVLGLWNGLQSLIGWLGDRISNFAGGIVGKIKGVFSIFSPSRVMANEIGVPLALGIGAGFTAAMPGVASAMASQLSGLMVGTPGGVAALQGSLGASGGRAGGSVPSVSVYIGSEQLTDIVRTEVRRSDDELATTLAGRMR